MEESNNSLCKILLKNLSILPGIDKDLQVYRDEDDDRWKGRKWSVNSSVILLQSANKQIDKVTKEEVKTKQKKSIHYKTTYLIYQN
jgi:hypothetical protein